jgi:diguanylate cyclase (GGDEF)-like protein
MTMTYVISLSIIAGLSILVHFMLDNIIEQQTDTATIVNVSGQQRMLSQRVSLFAMEYLSTGESHSKEHANQALALLQKNHQFLLSKYHHAQQNNLDTPFSEAISAIYFSAPHNVDNKIIEFTELVTLALANPPPLNTKAMSEVNLRFLELAKEPLLFSLNRVVEQYETESIQKVNELRLAQQVVFFIIIFTILAEAIFIFRPMVNKVSKFAEHLQQEANYDHLTGLLNRRSFSLLVDKALALSKRHKYALSVITFDIDYFKSINDTYGHDVGDKAIQHISNILKSTTRLSDCVARFGGEEFVVLLPQTEQKEALKLADKIREKINSSPLNLDKLIIEINVSGGVSQYLTQDNTADDMLKRADKGLYQAKNSGRNKIIQG